MSKIEVANMHSRDFSAGLNAEKKTDQQVYALANELPIASPLIPSQLSHYENDISLVDVALLVVKHRRVLFGVFAGMMIVGTLAALLVPKTYNYSAVVEVGSYRLPGPEGALGERQAIESIAQVKSKLEKRFIAAALLAYNQHNPDASLPSIKVAAPAESTVVELSMTGNKNNADAFNQLLSTISTELIADHNEKLLDVREQVMQSIEKQRIKVGEYAAQVARAESNKTLLNKSIADLTAEKTLLAQQLERMDRNLEKINQLKTRYSLDAQNARDGITRLLLDNQLLETQKQRDALETQQLVGINKKAATYATQLAAAEQALALNQLLHLNAQSVLQRYMGESNALNTAQNLNAVQNLPATSPAAEGKASQVTNPASVNSPLRAEPILNIDPTALVVAPHRSAEPTSLPITVMLGLLFFLALFLSFMSVFIYEFVQKVKSQARA